MNKNLLAEISKNKKLMGLNEDTHPSKISVSSDGTVNFWDLENKKVYRYKLIATTRITGEIPINVKSINLENKTIEYFEPEKNELKVDTINDETKKNIIENYKNKSDIENLYSFKHNGVSVTINLKFIEEVPITIK